MGKREGCAYFGLSEESATFLERKEGQRVRASFDCS